MAQHGRRRALGQHFLRDTRVCETISETAISLAQETGCKRLLEIGPGKGAITRVLLQKLDQDPRGLTEFVIVERDPRLAEIWSEDAASTAAAQAAALPGTKSGIPYRVELADFVEIPEEKWLHGETPLAVVSNLPYSAGTAILVKLARHVRDIPVMTLMFQAEVAARLRAVPSTKEWGSLSVWIQNRWDVTKLISVAPGAFVPPPDVQSEVVVLRRRSEPWIAMDASDPRQEELWEGLLRVAFAHRRKMLRSGLPSTGHWRNALEASGLDGTKRAEALNWQEWRTLFEALRSLHKI